MAIITTDSAILVVFKKRLLGSVTFRALHRDFCRVYNTLYGTDEQRATSAVFKRTN